jgi:hypothetical protein
MLENAQEWSGVLGDGGKGDPEDARRCQFMPILDASAIPDYSGGAEGSREQFAAIFGGDAAEGE